VKAELYHEVSVRADKQRFEQLNCQERIGLLRAA
jgi:hypothetical protein